MSEKINPKCFGSYCDLKGCEFYKNCQLTSIKSSPTPLSLCEKGVILTDEIVRIIKSLGESTCDLAEILGTVVANYACRTTDGINVDKNLRPRAMVVAVLSQYHEQVEKLEAENKKYYEALIKIAITRPTDNIYSKEQYPYAIADKALKENE